MTTLAAHIIFEDDEHDQAVVVVQTSQCWYRVAICGREATVIGPGVEFTLDFEGGSDMIPFENLNYKGMAMIAVITLEEQE